MDTRLISAFMRSDARAVAQKRLDKEVAQRHLKMLENLMKDYNVPIIASFRGPYDFLSNFYPCPVCFEGLNYSCAEAAFQAAKANKFKVRREFIGISAKEAKKMGRKLPLPSNWETVKYYKMQEILLNKFRDPFLRKKLLLTKDAFLIEGNTWNDHEWGVCDGYGGNMLGDILMRTRFNYRNAAEAAV